MGFCMCYCNKMQSTEEVSVHFNFKLICTKLLAGDNMLIYYPSQGTHSLNKYWFGIHCCTLDVGMHKGASRISKNQSKVES